MQFLVFVLVYPLIWLISLLPMRILYVISDGIYYLLYYVIRYRKKVVFDNIKTAFPTKSNMEITQISKKFYHHFVDIFIEMIKSFTISKKELQKRYVFENLEVLKKLENKGRSSILLGAHYANWEWIFILNAHINFNAYAIYKKIRNKYFDAKVRATRGRFNTHLIPTKKTFKLIEHNTKSNILSLYGFLGDQSPKKQSAHHWGKFLGVQVPIYTGVEFMAKKYDLPIVYFKTEKIRRGYYKNTLKLLTAEPRQWKDYDITDLFLRHVEEQIYKEPQYYFWTHKRFKHKVE
ncbi:MAG: lipid A biosynthesis acyltransferase [Flavobacteriales bacterium]|nr:MAG: lipid A biosynthesis acyltransferase [Flavobacteriales bacterium]